jgi:superfamily II DNA/RNA helicase
MDVSDEKAKGLPECIVAYMQQQKLAQPTPIQERFWPAALSGSDVVVRIRSLSTCPCRVVTHI